MQNIDDPTESLEETLTMAVSLVNAMSKHFERVAVEMADISYDEFERGTGFVGELVEARTLDRIVEVEAQYLQSVHRAFSRHASRLSDLYAAIGADLAEPIAATRPGA